VSSSLAERKAADPRELILYPAALLKVFSSFKILLVPSNREMVVSPFPNCIFFLSLALLLWLRFQVVC
jgi:hypothetical protein